MKSETYNRFNHHHLHYQHNHHIQYHLHINHKGTFLPMLCSSRPLIKDVQVPITKPNSASPNISCMAQVKRSNKVSGFPIPTNSTSTTQTTHNIKINITKYSKLKKLFSGKPFTPTKASNTATAPAGCPISRGARVSISSSSSSSSSNNVRQGSPRCVVAEMINVAEMDPPLPVVKREQRSPQQGEGSLYKRRSGAALKGLQVQPPRALQTQPTSVCLGRK